MTDLTKLDLFAIHHDPKLQEVLHRLQRERAAERAVTGGDRPVGLRLSIADPVRRVKAVFDPFWELNIDEGVGERGHILEDYLEVALFHGMYDELNGVKYDAQVPIQWHQKGRSAFDFVAADRVISCKTSAKSSRPSTANVEQEERMMTLAGYKAGSRFEIWVINPSTMRAVGPYPHTLSQDAIDAAQAELVNVTAAHAHFESILTGGGDPTTNTAWNTPGTWLKNWHLESSSGAFRYDTLDASAAIERRVFADAHARKKLAEASWEAEQTKQLIEPHVREQIMLARAEGRMVKTVRAYGNYDGNALYTLVERKDGSSYVKFKLEPLETAENAA